MTTNPTDAQMKLADVTQADREAAAWALDLAPNSQTWETLTAAHRTPDQIWQANRVAQAFAHHRLATEARAQGLVDALNGYKAALAFVAADAWDGCSDCIDVLKAARCADTVEPLTLDEIAANLKRIRLHYQPAIKHSQHGGERER